MLLHTTLLLSLSTSSGSAWSIYAIEDMPLGYLAERVDRGGKATRFYTRDFAFEKVTTFGGVRLRFIDATQPEDYTGHTSPIEYGNAWSGRAWEYVRDFDASGVPVKRYVTDARDAARPRSLTTSR